MAKTSADKEPTPSEQKPTAEARQLAERAIRGITGCGSIELQLRLTKLAPKTIAAIAKAEANNARDSIPKILLDSQLDDQKASS